MYIQPHYWTVLHLLAIFNPSAISQIPEYSEFKMPFLIDIYGKTPLHYLLAQKNRDYEIINIMLKYVLEYLQDKDRKIRAYEYQLICSSLSIFFLLIIYKLSPRLAYKYLCLCFPQTSSQHYEVIPAFGVSEQKYTYSHIPVMHPEVLKKLHQEGEERIIYRTNLIALDYDPRSDDMLATTHVLSEIQQESMFKLSIIENLIDHLWSSTRKTMYSMAIAYSTLMILLSLYIASDQKALYLEVLILLLTGLFSFIEFLQGITLKLEYFSNFWNWVDIAQLILIMIFISKKIIGIQEALGDAWLVTVVVILSYLRWLSYLRLFTPTRILIEIILAVLYDMLGFITIIASILIGFSLIFLEFSRNQSAPQDYGFQFYNTFKLLFGNYDDTDYTLSQTILVSVLLCVLNVVLLNLLIAIIGDSYGKVQEGRDLIDAKTRLDLIQEAIILMRRISPKKKREEMYLIYRLPAIAEEKSLEDEDWEVRISKIEKALKQSNNQGEVNFKTEMETVRNDMKENSENQTHQIMKMIEEKVFQLKSEVNDNIQATKKIEEQVSQIMNENSQVKTTMEDHMTQMKDEIQGLKQLINLVLTNMQK